MQERIISLAFAMDSSPGAYALLLGSGLSRSASIPTGWEVVVDLIERVATLKGQDTDGDPAGWYRQTYRSDPDYAVLLEALAAAPAERQRLLRKYFEPTESGGGATPGALCVHDHQGASASSRHTTSGSIACSTVCSTSTASSSAAGQANGMPRP